ncbi:MAG: hypothetical protein OXH09_23270 [Gammaproteobacteria bacterium]|nr:hypothetical protein [Gammaproteobacteria bacterium]
MAEARAGRDATTIDRLIVKGLTRYYHGIDNEARRALAAAEPSLTGTVWDSVVPWTREYESACTIVPALDLGRAAAGRSARRVPDDAMSVDSPPRILSPQAPRRA